MTGVVDRPAARPGQRRPGWWPLLADQARYATVELWRSRVVFVFTFLFPLTWLVVLGMLAGNEVIDASGMRVMQFVTPTAAVMGVLYATLPTMATSLATAREQGVLKRVRGTPLPAWIYLAGRIGAAVVFAVGSLVAMLLVGVLAYDVQIVWRTMPATAVTIIVAIACFAAAGMAVASLARSAGVAEAASIAAAVVLAFLSGLFSVGGGMPDWADRLAAVFPLQGFAQAMQDQFNPYLTGAGWDWRALAVMAAWGLGCGLVAARTFRWDPAAARRAETTREAAGSTRSLPGRGRETRDHAGIPAVSRSTAPGRPSSAAMLVDQIRHAATAAWRDPGWVFFAIAMPVGLFAFLMATNAANSEAVVGADGITLGLYFAAGMATWGAAVTAFVNTPEAVVRDRDRGVLKRLRGTPLSSVHVLAGRTVAAVLIAVVTAAVILAIAVLAFDVRVAWSGLALAIAVLVLGTMTFAACGFALAAALPSSKAVTAVGLAILLPVAFFSDVFIAGQTPTWMSTIGSLLPVKPVANSVAAALNPAGSMVDWSALAVLIGWLVVACVLAIRTFSWTSAREKRAAGAGSRR
jgi:ABC-2 type transport system permease protein